MKPIIWLLVISSITLQGFAQTKIIAHKSHSGTPTSFSTLSPDNFGYIAPLWEDKMYGAKKVIKLTDSVYVVVRPKEMGRARMVHPGITDTVFFSGSSFLKGPPSKEEILERYPNIQLVGFNDDSKKEETFPVVIPGNGKGMGMLLTLLLTLLVGLGWLIYRQEKVNFRTATLVMIGIILVFPEIHAQTKIIAHKSHSGNSSSFQVNGADHFGRIIPHELEDHIRYGNFARPRPLDLPKPIRVTKISSELIVIESRPIFTLDSVSGSTFDTVAVEDYIFPPEQSVDTNLLRAFYPKAKIEGFDQQEKEYVVPIIPQRPDGNGPLFLFLIIGVFAIFFSNTLWKKNTHRLAPVPSNMVQ